MMDALMYGMMPRAKTESLSSPPPANMSKKPSNVPCGRGKNARQHTAVDPGRRDVDTDSVDGKQRQES